MTATRASCCATPDGEFSTFADTGGSPWGAILGSDGAIYVTQGGNVPGSGDFSAVPGIQRVNADGSVELLASTIAGHPLAGPNDLAFGPDGRLWFTDSGTEGDDRYPERQPGRLYVMDSSGDGELVIERPNVYPNGIAFDAQNRLYWTESMGHRVCRLENGEATTFAQLSDDHVPDGMAFAADGRAFVCTTISGGLTVLSAEGEVLEEIFLGRVRDELHLRRPDALRHVHEGGRPRLRTDDRQVLERRDRRRRRAAADSRKAVAQTATRSPLAIARSHATRAASVASASAGLQGTAAGSPLPTASRKRVTDETRGGTAPVTATASPAARPRSSKAGSRASWRAVSAAWTSSA